MLKEHMKKFDEALEDDLKKESSKSHLKEHIEKFDESLGEPIEELTMSDSYTPTNEKLSPFAPIERLENEIKDKDKIIENLKKESTELMKHISIIENEKSTMLEDLEKSRWLENKVTLATKQVYEEKIQTVINENVDSKIIPVLTSAARRKQGNQKLNWGNWLKIPENKYLFQINEDIAKGIFEDTNALIPKKRTRGSSGTEVTKIYALSFTGDTAADSRLDYVETTFNPDSYDGAGTGLNRGFTVSYWVKPLEEMTGDPNIFIAFGKRSQADGRFEFGVKNANKIKIGIGSAEKDDNTHKAGLGWEAGDDNVAHGAEVGKWSHWVVTYGGDNDVGGDRQVRVYMDGVEILKNDASGGGMGTANWDSGKQNNDIEDDVNQGSYLFFGGRSVWAGIGDGGNDGSPYNQGWACALSEVAIYNTEKDEDGTFANEVYNSGTNYDHSDNAGLVGYWKFNEGSGTTVKDYGPYGKHGTLTSDTSENASPHAGSGTPTWVER
jgi:hypothetical protein